VTSAKSLVTWLRIEALFVFVGTVALYVWSGASWWVFALLFLAPDLSILGYLANPRVGAVTYNIAHAYVGPVFLVIVDMVLANLQGASDTFGSLAPIALIWASHIAFDRVLGYGLKSPDNFKITHLGHIGQQETKS